MFPIVQNTALPYACQIEILEALACLMSTFKRRNFPSARLASAASGIDSDTFRSRLIRLTGIFVLLVHNFMDCLNLWSCSTSSL